jgi:hypothetical protein
MALTDDPRDPRLTHESDTEPRPQAEVYLVLSEAERARGFVRPLYRSYAHSIGGCGAITRMGLALCETYARRPDFYGATYCSGCMMHRPVGPEGEFTWIDDFGRDTGARVGA